MGELFGDKLKKLRLERELSQQQLADLLGTSKQVISRYETNQRTPKITIAQEYADKLNVPLNYLIDETVSSIDVRDRLINPNTGAPATKREITQLEEVLKMDNLTFMGAPLDEDDKEKIKRALELAFWDAKDKNKRK